MCYINVLKKVNFFIFLNIFTIVYKVNDVLYIKIIPAASLK